MSPGYFLLLTVSSAVLISPANTLNLLDLVQLTSGGALGSGGGGPIGKVISLLTGGSQQPSAESVRQQLEHEQDQNNYTRYLMPYELQAYSKRHLDKFVTLPAAEQQLCLRVALAYMESTSPVMNVIKNHLPNETRRLLIDWLDLFFRQKGATTEALMNLVEGLPADGVVKQKMVGLGLGRALTEWYTYVKPYKPYLKAAAAVGTAIG